MSSMDDEFEQRIQKWGATKAYAYFTIAASVFLAVISVLLGVTDEKNRTVALVLLAMSVVFFAGSVWGLRKIRYIEEHPEAKNPRRNPVAREMFRFEKKHPVLNAIIGIAFLALAIWLKLR